MDVSGSTCGRLSGRGAWIAALAVGCALVAAVMGPPASAAAQSTLRLEPPPLPEGFGLRRLNAVDAQVAALDERIASADGPQRVVLTAQRNVRLIVRQLFKADADARAAGESRSVATVAAMTLGEQLEAFDRSIADLPDQVFEAIGAGEAGAERLAQLKRAVKALRAFNQRVAADEAGLVSAEPAAVDGYLQRLLGPLATVEVALSGAAPVSAWPARSPAQRRMNALNGRDIAALEKRVGKAELTEATRGELRWLLTMMRRVLGEADLQPRVTAYARWMGDLLDAAETFARSQTLDEPATNALGVQVHQAVLLLKAPATRDQGVARIEHLERIARLVETVDALGRLEPEPPAPLGRLVMAVHQLGMNENTAGEADRLARLLERMLGTMIRHRQVDDSQALPLHIRRVYQVLDRQYVKLEREMIHSLPALAGSPTTAAEPAWTEPVGQLADLMTQLQYLREVPAWVKRVGRFNSRAGGGLYQQLRLIAEDLLNPSTHHGAAGALAAMDRQLALFEQLPYEKQVEDGDAVMRLLGDHREGIGRQLTLQRSQWAASWATGADPTPPGERLLLLRRLFVAAHDARQLQQMTRKQWRTIDRWGAWRIERRAVDPLLEWIVQRIDKAAADAGAGRWDELAGALNEIEQQAPVAWLAWRIEADLDAALKRVPGGWAGALSQTLYPPTHKAYGTDQRQRLAELTLYLAAADQRRRSGDVAGARELMSYCGDLASGILRDLEGAADHARPAAPPRAIDI